MTPPPKGSPPQICAAPTMSMHHGRRTPLRVAEKKHRCTLPPAGCWVPRWLCPSNDSGLIMVCVSEWSTKPLCPISLATSTFLPFLYNPRFCGCLISDLLQVPQHTSFASRSLKKKPDLHFSGPLTAAQPPDRPVQIFAAVDFEGRAAPDRPEAVELGGVEVLGGPFGGLCSSVCLF